MWNNYFFSACSPPAGPGYPGYPYPPFVHPQQNATKTSPGTSDESVQPSPSSGGDEGREGGNKSAKLSFSVGSVGGGLFQYQDSSNAESKEQEQASSDKFPASTSPENISRNTSQSHVGEEIRQRRLERFNSVPASPQETILSNLAESPRDGVRQRTGTATEEEGSAI